MRGGGRGETVSRERKGVPSQVPVRASRARVWCTVRDLRPLPTPITRLCTLPLSVTSSRYVSCNRHLRATIYISPRHRPGPLVTVSVTAERRLTEESQWNSSELVHFGIQVKQAASLHLQALIGEV